MAISDVYFGFAQSYARPFPLSMSAKSSDEERQPHGIRQHDLIFGAFFAAHDEIRNVQLEGLFPLQAA
jgi:hypothetical protein